MRSNVTGVGPYNSEYRNSHRGFGRGNARPFQPSQRQHSPQPTRRGDLFLEAGKLAVEYLVSHGLLPSNVLPGKRQNGNLRNSSRDPLDHRSSHDRESRYSPDGFSGSRKSMNDQEPSFTRSSSRERRRYGASRSYSSDWSRENGREGSLSDKATASQGNLEADNGKFPKENSKDADTDIRDPNSTESESKDEKLKDHFLPNSNSFSKEDEEVPGPSDGVNTGCEETVDDTGNLDMKKKTFRDDYEEKNDDLSNSGTDRLKLCPSDNIPAEGHSSLADENPKSDPSLMSAEKNPSHAGSNSVEPTKDVTVKGASEIPSLNETSSSSCVVTSLNPAYSVEQQRPVESLLFNDKSFSYEQRSSDRGEKRALEEEDMVEGAKRAKQWLSVAQGDDFSQLSGLGEKQSLSLGKMDGTVNHFDGCANQDRFNNSSLPIKDNVESAIQQGEQKQLFSSSFKICDLNLMEASDVHESHDVPSLLYPSISAPNKDASVGIDLSMNNNCSMNNGYNDSGSARKDIEIIDLESGSLQESKNIPTRNTEADITNMGNFPNNSQNSNVNPDGQDGYGFMISELLDNDVSNCSTVQPDINPLHNDMGLPHGEGMFSEDDPIYMSLGEIPLSLLRVWEQPTQERNPFEL